jgi:hypothetical protein
MATKKNGDNISCVSGVKPLLSSTNQQSVKNGARLVSPPNSQPQPQPHPQSQQLPLSKETATHASSMPTSSQNSHKESNEVPKQIVIDSNTPNNKEDNSNNDENKNIISSNNTSNTENQNAIVLNHSHSSSTAPITKEPEVKRWTLKDFDIGKLLGEGKFDLFQKERE